MSLKSVTGAERRAFFRINDTVIVDFVVITDDPSSQAAHPMVDDHQQRTHLSTVQTALSHLIEKINHSDRDLGRALRLLDEKLNLISQRLEAKLSPADMSKAIEVNLSAGGLAFISTDYLAPKTTLQVSLQLLPSLNTVYLMAKVIACDSVADQTGEPGYLLRMAFTGMSEDDRNLLVRHTLSRQAESLRAQKAPER